MIAPSTPIAQSSSSSSSVPAQHTDHLHIFQRPAWGQRMKIASARLRYHPACVLVYVGMMLTSVLLIIWEFAQQKHTVLTLALEGFINFVLVVEVAIGICAEQWKYFEHCWNVLDFCIALLCTAFFFFIEHESARGKDGSSLNYAEILLFGLRYGMQIGRVGIMIWRGRVAGGVAVQEEVSFPSTRIRNLDTEAERAAPARGESPSSRHHFVNLFWSIRDRYMEQMAQQQAATQEEVALTEDQGDGIPQQQSDEASEVSTSLVEILRSNGTDQGQSEHLSVSTSEPQAQ